MGPYYVAVGGLLGAFALSCALETSIALVGQRGSLFETQKRAALPPLIYANIFCVLAQVGFNAYATNLLYSDPPECSPAGGKPWDPTEVLWGLVWSTWAVIFGIAGLAVTAYNIFPDYQSSEQWERQCGWWSLACCGCRRGSVDHGTASKRLGALFALMFSHIDLTPSDIMVAFGLALDRQRLLRRVASRRMSQASRRAAGVPSNVVLGGTAASGDRSDRSKASSESPGSADGLLGDIELGVGGARGGSGR